MTLVVDALATLRLTRLVVSDTVAEPIRHRVLSWAETPRDGAMAHPRVAELLGCSWCTSIWTAAAVVFARRAMPRAWAPVAELLACSAVAAMWATLTDPDASGP